MTYINVAGYKCGLRPLPAAWVYLAFGTSASFENQPGRGSAAGNLKAPLYKRELERPIHTLEHRATVSDFSGVSENRACGPFPDSYLFLRADLRTWSLMWWGLGRSLKPKQVEDLDSWVAR